MSDARFPAFDRDSQYLYFTASTNYGPTSSGLDMTSDEHEVTRSVYLAVLSNNIASPLVPDSDEEDAQHFAGGAAGAAGRAPVVRRPRPIRRRNRCASISTSWRNALWRCRCRPGLTPR